MPQFVKRLVAVFKPPPGLGIDAAAGAFAIGGLLCALCAVVAWDDGTGIEPETAWYFTIVAAAFILCALAGFVVMGRRSRRRRRAQVEAGLPAHLEVAALAVAAAALDWSPFDRAEYLGLHEQTDGTRQARTAIVRALHRAGRIGEPTRDIVGQLTDVGAPALDVFLAVLATDLVEYQVWETMTRWWRAADLEPALPRPVRRGTAR